MKLNRNAAVRIYFLLDNLLPPFIRDSRIFMGLLFRIMFGQKAPFFLELKDKAPSMTQKEFKELYASMGSGVLERATDLNDECVDVILKSIDGSETLEVGCRKAYLSNKIQQAGYKVTAVDLHIENDIRERYKKIQFLNGDIENLEFEDNKFDTVVCTHTLEHVKNISKGIEELRRVCKKRLIIVVPRQRPYRYTFDLHLHFFPYKHSLLLLMNNRNYTMCEVIGGDILYIEDATK
jgi:SAM-dependent methyltransferase